MLKTLSYILLYLHSGVCGLTIGLFYTLFFASTQGQGLAAGGILVFNALVGMLLGLIVAIFITVKIDNRQIRRTNIILLAINAVQIIILALIIKSNI